MVSGLKAVQIYTSSSSVAVRYCNEAYAWFSYPCVTFWAYFHSLKLKYIGLQGHHAMCLCVCVLFPSLQLYKHLTVGVKHMHGSAIHVLLFGPIFFP